MSATRGGGGGADVALPMRMVMRILEMVLARDGEALSAILSTPGPSETRSKAGGGGRSARRSLRGPADPSPKARAVFRRRLARERVGAMLTLAAVSRGWRELVLSSATPLVGVWREVCDAVRPSDETPARRRWRRLDPSSAVTKAMRYMVGVKNRQWQPDRGYLAPAIENGAARGTLVPRMFRASVSTSTPCSIMPGRSGTSGPCRAEGSGRGRGGTTAADRSGRLSARGRGATPSGPGGGARRGCASERHVPPCVAPRGNAPGANRCRCLASRARARAGPRSAYASPNRRDGIAQRPSERLKENQIGDPCGNVPRSLWRAGQTEKRVF